MEELQQENLELVRRLAAQEEALGYSNRQLDQRSSDCQALSRQLEAALSDVRLQVRLRGGVVTSGEEVSFTKRCVKCFSYFLFFSSNVPMFVFFHPLLRKP